MYDATNEQYEREETYLNREAQIELLDRINVDAQAVLDAVSKAYCEAIRQADFYFLIPSDVESLIQHIKENVLDGRNYGDISTKDTAAFAIKDTAPPSALERIISAMQPVRIS